MVVALGVFLLLGMLAFGDYDTPVADFAALVCGLAGLTLILAAHLVFQLVAEGRRAGCVAGVSRPRVVPRPSPGAFTRAPRGHRYDLSAKGSRPSDPGWHECSCREWEGYWSAFEPHVADHLRAAVRAWLSSALLAPEVVEAAARAHYGTHLGVSFDDETDPMWRGSRIEDMTAALTAALSALPVQGEEER